MAPLISVIIPVYNVEKYLMDCLDSIIAQDYTPLEVILVNDGSTDSSGEICRTYRARHSNIKYIEQANGGVSKARNRGIEEASGAYLAFIDSDDSVGREYFQKLYCCIEKENADLCLGSISDSNGCKMHMNSTVVDFTSNQTEDFYELNTRFLLYGPVAKLYKTSIIEQNKIRFPEDMSYGEDLVFNCRYLSVCNRIVYENSVSYFYCRDNQQSLSQKFRPDRFDNELLLYEELKKLYKAKKVYDMEYEAYLQQRVFDEGYNSVFDALRAVPYDKEKHCAIRRILTDERFKESINWVDKGKYSKAIVGLMRMGSPRLLRAYYSLRA